MRNESGPGGQLGFHYNLVDRWSVRPEITMMAEPTGNIDLDMPVAEMGFGPDYRLRTTSPLIDAGQASFSGAEIPAVDIDGDPRPFDGDGDGVAAFDLGADELVFEAGCGEDGYCNPECGLDEDPDCATEAGIVLTPSELEMPTTAYEEASEPGFVTATSVGAVAVTVADVEVQDAREPRTGYESRRFDFELVADSGTCPDAPFTLDPGESCTFGVVFAPSSFDPPWRLAELAVTTDGGDTVYAFLSGFASSEGAPVSDCDGDCCRTGARLPPADGAASSGLFLLALVALRGLTRARRTPPTPGSRPGDR
jgi:hypothetical protein